MMYKKLVDEYFKHNKEGTVREMKEFIRNRFFQKFKDEQYADWLKVKYSIYGNRKWDFDLRAERKIMNCESLSKHLIKRMNDKELIGNKGKDGRWTYKLNSHSTSTNNKEKKQ